MGSIWIHAVSKLQVWYFISSAGWCAMLCPALEQHFSNIYLPFSLRIRGQIHWFTRLLMNKITIVIIVGV